MLNRAPLQELDTSAGLVCLSLCEPSSDEQVAEAAAPGGGSRRARGPSRVVPLLATNGDFRRGQSMKVTVPAPSDAVMDGDGCVTHQVSGPRDSIFGEGRWAG